MDTGVWVGWLAACHIQYAMQAMQTKEGILFKKKVASSFLPLNNLSRAESAIDTGVRVVGWLHATYSMQCNANQGRNILQKESQSRPPTGK
jgi:hypothetical protein